MTDTRMLKWALRLVAAGLTYNVVEAVVALWAGVEADSIALLGFGVESVLECSVAVMMLWRLLVETRGGAAERVEKAEQRVLRFVGVAFFVLAAYVVVQASLTLVSGDRPGASVVGIVLAVASLVIMPGLAGAKLYVGGRMGSLALRAEAKATVACAYLSFALLVGLILNWSLGWWWADPVAALCMVPWLIREGIQGVRGKKCC